MAWLSKKKIVVPIDFSDFSFAALDAALEMVDDASHICAVHVLPVLLVAEPGMVWDAIDDESRKKNAEEALREKIDGDRFAGLDVRILVGDPGFEIADLAEKIAAELIVMPSHGRTGVKRLLIGSVAERVVRTAHCPVLVLRSPS